MRRRGWITVTGPLYHCSDADCQWFAHGDEGASRKAAAAAHRHADETGHSVIVERGQTSYIDPGGRS